MWFGGGALVCGGCGELPEGPNTCPETAGATGGAGDTGGSGGGPCKKPTEPDECASPPKPFAGPGQVVRCQGQAEGVILYTQNTVNTQDPAASPGEPEATVFTLDDGQVQACCTLGEPGAGENIEQKGCVFDCGRAACNRALERVLNRANLSDPSEGACPGGTLGDTCRDNVRNSLNAWADAILDGYGTCLDAASSNGGEVGLDLWDRDVLAAGVELMHTKCDGKALLGQAGCLYDAVLRVRCVVEEYQVDETATCEMPANDASEGANVDDDSAVGPGPGAGSLTGPGAPAGERPVWFTGGSWHTVCDGGGEAPCRHALRALSFRVPGAVQLGPWVRVTQLEGWLARPVVGAGPAEGYQVLGAAAGRARLSGVLVLGGGPGAAQVPVTFNVALDGPVVVHVEAGAVRVEHLALARGGRRLTVRSDVLPLEGGA